jgi:hypothetical protein
VSPCAPAPIVMESATSADLPWSDVVTALDSATPASDPL